jgi:hypothetical protein
MTPERDKTNPFFWNVSREFMLGAAFTAGAFRMGLVSGYDMKDDRTWIRISHDDKHLVMQTPGKVDGL